MKAKLAALGVLCVPRLEGNYEAGDLSIEFSCADAETILDMSANVRGNGNPLPTLRTLCAGTSWVVVEDATGNSVLDSVEASDAWNRFKEWRDRSVSKVSKRGGRKS